jgi:hypothetical protein
MPTTHTASGSSYEMGSSEFFLGWPLQHMHIICNICSTSVTLLYIKIDRISCSLVCLSDILPYSLYLAPPPPHK